MRNYNSSKISSFFVPYRIYIFGCGSETSVQLPVAKGSTFALYYSTCSITIVITWMT